MVKARYDLSGVSQEAVPMRRSLLWTCSAPANPIGLSGSVSTEAACSISWTELEEEAGLRRHSTLGGSIRGQPLPCPV